MQSQGQFLLALPGHKFQLSPCELSVTAEMLWCQTAHTVCADQGSSKMLTACLVSATSSLMARRRSQSSVGEGQAPWTFTIAMLVSTAARLMDQRGEFSTWIPAGGRGDASPLPNYLEEATCPSPAPGSG